MTPIDCRHESEIIDEIGAGRWPEHSPASLQAHAASCPVCSDLAVIASAMHDTAPVSAAPMALPSAGQVWWRAELRARHEALRLAQRPLIAVQVVAAVVCLAALVCGVRAVAPGAWTWLVQATTLARAGDVVVGPWGLLLALSAGLWLVLAPAAIYMVLRADRQGGR